MMDSPRPRGAFRSLFPIAVGIVLIDQLSKLWAESALGSGREIPVIGQYLFLSLTHNHGAAFGLLPGASVLLALLAAVAALLLAVYGRYLATGRFRTVTVALLLGGALGNLIDRVRFGYVIDFVATHFWPTFNIADVAITMGALLLAWSLLQTTEGAPAPANGHPSDPLHVRKD